MTSAQEAAVDAMTEAARGHVGHFDNGDVRWVCECAEASGHDLDSYVRHVNQVALTALLSPTKKPCAQCGGSGIDPDDPFNGDPSGMDMNGGLIYYTPSVEDDPCPTCNGDGFVLAPAPIEGSLEQVGWAQRADDTRKLHAADDPARHFGWILTDHRNASGHAVPVFRLPSKVSDE